VQGCDSCWGRFNYCQTHSLVCDSLSLANMATATLLSHERAPEMEQGNASAASEPILGQTSMADSASAQRAEDLVSGSGTGPRPGKEQEAVDGSIGRDPTRAATSRSVISRIGLRDGWNTEKMWAKVRGYVVGASGPMEILRENKKQLRHEEPLRKWLPRRYLSSADISQPAIPDSRSSSAVTIAS
jgi:hypothetical protein